MSGLLAEEAGLGHPLQLLPPGATRRWRSTVCSASVLRRKWGGAAGSRGEPGPVGRQGRMRWGPRPCGPPLICCEEMVPGQVSRLCCSPPHFPTSLTAQMCLPICSSRGHFRDEDREPGTTSQLQSKVANLLQKLALAWQPCLRLDPVLGLVGIPRKLPDLETILELPCMRTRPPKFSYTPGLPF